MINNIFLVIFLFGLVSVIFWKMKGEPQNNRRPGGMPPFGQGPRTDKMPRKRPAQRPYGEPAENGDRDLRRQTERQDEPIAEPTLQPAAMAAPAAAASSPVRGQSKQDAPSAAGHGNRHPAVQGMMWAEVFGPPRAKRPHRGKK